MAQNLQKHFLTPMLSGFEILSYSMPISQNWLFTQAISNIFHHPNFIYMNLNFCILSQKFVVTIFVEIIF